MLRSIYHHATLKRTTLASILLALFLIALASRSVTTLARSKAAPGSPTEQTTTNPAADADLSVIQADLPDPVIAGNRLSYTLTVTNSGPAIATQVTLTDTLPSGVTFASATPDQGTCSHSGGIVTCDLVILASGDTAQVVIRVDVSSTTAGVITNTVHVTARQPDPNPINNTNVIENTTVLQTDLAIIKSDSPDPVMAGDDLVYTVIVANNGPDDAPGVVVTDTLPAEISFVSAEPTQGNCAESNGVVTCELGNLVDGATAVVTITVTAPNAAVTIDKTFSLNGTCPGEQTLPFGNILQPVTLCYEITNTGDTDLDTITITDTVKTPAGPQVIATITETSATNPALPLAPGEQIIVSQTLDRNIPILCNDQETVVAAEAVGTISNVVTVAVMGNETDANASNNTHTEETNMAGGVVQATDVVETPCKGVDWRLQLPALNAAECETWIQVQNVGDKATQVRLRLWGGESACQFGGGFRSVDSGMLRPGSTWTFTTEDMPRYTKAGVVLSLKVTDGGQTSERGEPLVVTVKRTCPDPVDPTVYSTASYVSISSDRLGVRDPRAGDFAYYAPIVWADFNGMRSLIHIQNAGEKCTSVGLWFQRLDSCVQPVVWEILSLAPNASYTFDPNLVVGPQWQGSVWLSASQPLAIVVDTWGANHFGAYHAVPAEVSLDDNSGDFTLGTQVNYAPLIYREYQGWDTNIYVQNLSPTYNAKVKVHFLDASGDVIQTLVDWICPRGSQVFFLPVVAGLPGNWVGSARIESQDWLSSGDPAIETPRILSVVMLEKYTDPARTARQEAVVYNALQEMGAFDWQLGPGQTTGFSGSDVLAIPFVARGYLGVSSEIAIQNLNPNPGSTDFVLFLYDPRRFIDSFCQTLNARQVEYIDLDEWDVIPPGFMGSLVISATRSDQVGGAALGAVVVERVGRLDPGQDVPGDESRAFEASPLFHRFKQEAPIQCPGQP